MHLSGLLFIGISEPHPQWHLLPQTGEARSRVHTTVPDCCKPYLRFKERVCFDIKG
ncbi:hypothetical protein FOMPIDRAFT_92989 [Fomitopsis schrenkii]|uniref:Uncharacterized protein n=1 Tax=Fomitopsis schrenkii TaxID=2126942 RepID=S8DWD6_FOMSC|nr:hypothetical protein FOMPIDRAFT_92989 [Fomitopsis schrenkii]